MRRREPAPTSPFEEERNLRRAGRPRERAVHLHGPKSRVSGVPASSPLAGGGGKGRGSHGAPPRGGAGRRTTRLRSGRHRRSGRGGQPAVVARAARRSMGCFPPVAGGDRSVLLAGGSRAHEPGVEARVPRARRHDAGLSGAQGSGGPPRARRSRRSTGPGVVEERALEREKPRRAPARRPGPGQGTGRDGNGLPRGARLRSGRVGRSPPSDGAFEGPVEVARASVSDTNG